MERDEVGSAHIDLSRDQAFDVEVSAAVIVSVSVDTYYMCTLCCSDEPLRVWFYT